MVMASSESVSGDPSGERITRRLDRLEQIEAVRGLLDDYATLCDERRLDALLELFEPSATVESAQVHAGRAAIRAFYEAAFRADASVKRHFVSNVRIRAVDRADASPGSKARFVVDSYFLMVRLDDPERIGVVGRYEDEIAVEAGRARFRRRAIRMKRSE